MTDPTQPTDPAQPPENKLVYPGPRERGPSDPDVGLLDVREVAPEEIVLSGHGRDEDPYPRGTFMKIGTAMATLVALIVATYYVSWLEFARPWTPEDPVPFWNLVGREIMGEEPTEQPGAEKVEAAQELAAATLDEVDVEPIEDDPVVVEPPPSEQAPVLPPYRAHADDELAVPRALDMPNAEALDPLFEQLARTEARWAGEVTRVTHWGDSVIANDNVTSTLRAVMQRRFGDSGHGFHLLAKPNASYRHRGISFHDGQDWSRCYIINNCKKDGRYGLGGTTVWSAGGGRSVFATTDKTPYGRKVSRFELWYLSQPRAGKIRLRVDDEEPTYLEASADEEADAWHALEVSDGPHALEVRASGGGVVRAYGVVMERDVPGVVWDGMAQLGAFTSRMLNFEPDHLRAQIEHRDPDLLVFQFGGNDLLVKAPISRYKQQFADMLKLFRGPQERPCLVVAPVDHGRRVGGRVESVANMERVTRAQREVALAEGCAFFDTRAAMGGQDSVARWRYAKPPLISGDLAHLTNAGQRALGRMIYLALMEQYRAYRKRTDGP